MSEATYRAPGVAECLAGEKAELEDAGLRVEGAARAGRGQALVGVRRAVMRASCGHCVVAAALAACGDNAVRAPDPYCADWHQWGGNAAHTGASCSVGQPLQKILADVLIDPLVADEVAGALGDLFVHYQAPLIDGDRVAMVRKGGTFTPCVPETDPLKYCRHPRTASLRDADVVRGRLRVGGRRARREVDLRQRVEAAARPGGRVPAGDRRRPRRDPRGGRCDRVCRSSDRRGRSGRAAVRARRQRVHRRRARRVARRRVLQRGAVRHGDARRAGRLVARRDRQRRSRAQGPLRRPRPRARRRSATARTSTSSRCRRRRSRCSMRAASSCCRRSFRCGPQVPGFNAAPAIADDGTVYVVSSAYGNESYSYMMSVNPGYFDVNWSRSLRDQLTTAAASTSRMHRPARWRWSDCTDGAPMGVDPETGLPPAGWVDVGSTSSPVVHARRPRAVRLAQLLQRERGHLFEFSRAGKVLGTYDFGWDLTPAVARSAARRASSSRTTTTAVHAGHRSGPVLPDDARRRARAGLAVPEHRDQELRAPARRQRELHGRSPARLRVVHQRSRDRRERHDVCEQRGRQRLRDGADGQVRDHLLLDTALGAAYTPVVLDREGRVYALNAGHLYVVGATEPNWAGLR